jgi:L-fuculose-phosphate aldolase
MRTIVTANDVESLLRAGKPVPTDAMLTPSARDLLRSRMSAVASAASRPQSNGEGPARLGGASGAPIVPDYEFKWKPGSDPKTPAEIQAFFRSPAIETIKRRMVDIGRRMWEKDYTDGNGGNITVRVGDGLVLCTPTLISKGFMSVEDMALIDLDGKQLAGSRKRTSEAMTHLAIMKRQPAAKACVHAHPPHATAYAVARVRPPTCLIPEAEVFLGKIGYAEYQTPGTPENAKVVGDAAVDNQCVLMENHGVITWGKDVEDAYWKMENADAYCKTIWVASQLGGQLGTGIGGNKVKDLIALRKTLGMPDSREGLKECELCDNSEFRPGVVCQVPARDGTSAEPPADPAIEALVNKIADQIFQQLNKG